MKMDFPRLLLSAFYFLVLTNTVYSDISGLNGGKTESSAPLLKSVDTITTPQSLLQTSLASINVSNGGTRENVTAQLGSSVFLGCKTQHSMERQVSWVRRRDWHILTSGTAPYTKEERFFVHHPEGSTEWTLEIKYVQLSDEGTYECQIATGGGIISHQVHVRVVSPIALIPGNGEYHVETGSTITLDCIIEQSPIAPQFIFWYHNERMINYDTERGGVKVTIDKGPPEIRSRLTVTDARSSDSGNYTCTAENTASASILVYITEANNIAVIQTGSSSDAGQQQSVAFLLTSSSLAFAFYYFYFVNYDIYKQSRTS